MKTNESTDRWLQNLKFLLPETVELDEASIVSTYHKNHSEKSGTAIKILSIFGGVLGSLAFVSFIFIMGLENSNAGLLINGIIFITAAIMLSKYNKIFIDTVSICAYTIGLFLLAYTLNRLLVGDNIVCIVLIVTACCSLAIVQNFTISFLSILVIHGCILSLFISNNLYIMIPLYAIALTFGMGYVFMNELKLIRSNLSLLKLYNPLQVGLVLSFISTLILVSKKGVFEIPIFSIWLLSISIALTIIYLIYFLQKKFHVVSDKQIIIICFTSLIMLLPTLPAPSINGSILVILLSFGINYKTGLAIGLLALAYSFSQYYYDLSLSLLAKSGLLIISGLVFLLISLLINMYYKKNENTL